MATTGDRRRGGKGAAESEAVDDAVPPLGKVLEFLRLLWALDHGLQRSSKRMHGSLGVTGPQRLVIRIVGRFPGISAGRLARIIHLHPSTLSGVLARLESRGLLERRADPFDGRRALFRLTGRGRSVDERSEGTIERQVELVLAKVPEAKLEVVSEVLGTLTASLDGALGRPAPAVARAVARRRASTRQRAPGTRGA